jgi:hypothetical protein
MGRRIHLGHLLEQVTLDRTDTFTVGAGDVGAAKKRKSKRETGTKKVR